MRRTRSCKERQFQQRTVMLSITFQHSSMHMDRKGCQKNHGQKQPDCGYSGGSPQRTRAARCCGRDQWRCLSHRALTVLQVHQKSSAFLLMQDYAGVWEGLGWAGSRLVACSVPCSSTITTSAPRWHRLVECGRGRRKRRDQF